MFKKIKDWYHDLPDKKKYIEFITALLTVPVLLTVLMINLANLNNNKKETTPTPTEKIVVVTQPDKPTSNLTSTITPTASECKKEVGPVKISTPSEDQLVSTNPVCLNISYQTGEYCSVVWSYRIDSGDWSDFTDKEVCLYDMTPGLKELELRVKSSQSDDEITLVRNFYYKSKEAPSVTPSVSLTPMP